MEVSDVVSNDTAFSALITPTMKKRSNLNSRKVTSPQCSKIIFNFLLFLIYLQKRNIYSVENINSKI